MRISDCNKDNVAVSIEKLHKYNEKLKTPIPSCMSEERR